MELFAPLAIVASCVVYFLIGYFVAPSLKVVLSGEMFSKRRQNDIPSSQENTPRPSRVVYEHSENSTSNESTSGSESDDIETMRIKMVLVVLKKPESKISDQLLIASTTDAALAVLKIIYASENQDWWKWYSYWNRVGVAKIAVKCPSVEMFSAVMSRAEKEGLPVANVGGIALAIGPTPANRVDPITGSMKLL